MNDRHEGWQVDLTPARPGQRRRELPKVDEGAEREAVSITDLVEAVEAAAVLLAEVGAKLDAVRNQISDVAYPAGVGQEIAKARRRIRESAVRISPRDPGTHSSTQSGPTS